MRPSIRHIVSSGSVKAIWLNKAELLDRLAAVTREAVAVFPEIRDIRLFGSLARGDETGLSDVDIFILVSNGRKNPIERMKPYFNFFADRLDIAVDMIVAHKNEIDSYKEILKDSFSLIN